MAFKMQVLLTNKDNFCSVISVFNEGYAKPENPKIIFMMENVCFFGTDLSILILWFKHSCHGLS